MNTLLKIGVVVFVMTLLPFTTKAQDMKIMGGLGLSYTTDINSIGISARGVYQIDDQWEAGAAFTHIFKHNYTNWSMLDLDGHYVFSSDDSKAFYGLAGLNFTFWKIHIPSVHEAYLDNWDASGTEVGLNLGAGGRYSLSDKINLVGELKYTIGGFGFLTLGAGVLYNF
jgi:hypothetical protein